MHDAGPSEMETERHRARPHPRGAARARHPQGTHRPVREPPAPAPPKPARKDYREAPRRPLPRHRRPRGREHDPQRQTRSAKGTQEAPGARVAQKRGLNRALAGAAPGETNASVRWAAKREGLWTLTGAPAHTSTTCHQCGHRDSTSRESQARFWCTACGWTGNADDNAAKVSQQRGRGRLRAYLAAIEGNQRREGVASKPARGAWKDVPVLIVRAGDDPETVPCPHRAHVAAAAERARDRTAQTSATVSV